MKTILAPHLLLLGLALSQVCAAQDRPTIIGAAVLASENVDISFIMALQSARLLMVLAFGPSLARLVARLVKD